MVVVAWAWCKAIAGDGGWLYQKITGFTTSAIILRSAIICGYLCASVVNVFVAKDELGY